MTDAHSGKLVSVFFDVQIVAPVPSPVSHPGNLESNRIYKMRIIRMKLRNAQKVFRVLISRGKITPDPLVCEFTYFSMDQEHMQNIFTDCLFSFVHKWTALADIHPQWSNEDALYKQGCLASMHLQFRDESKHSWTCLLATKPGLLAKHSICGCNGRGSRLGSELASLLKATVQSCDGLLTVSSNPGKYGRSRKRLHMEKHVFS